jgi:outer membrane receptor protein involved in Fe transport
LEASVFYREVTNLIQWSPGPSGQWRPVNIGKSRFFGVESELRALIDIPLISSYLETTVNGNYLYPEDRTKESATFGEVIPRKPLWQANGIVSLTHDRGHSLRAELRNVGYRYITAANTKWFDPYTVFDLAATVVLGQGFELILAADNVFDVSYVDMREYPVPGTELSAEVKYEF